MIELQKYHNIVLSFYRWLFDYLGTLHKEDIEKAKQYEGEYFRELGKMFTERVF